MSIHPFIHSSTQPAAKHYMSIQLPSLIHQSSIYPSTWPAASQPASQPSTYKLAHHSSTYLYIQPSIKHLPSIQPRNQLFIHPRSIPSLIHPAMIHPLIHAFIHPSSIPSLIHPSHHACTHPLIQPSFQAICCGLALIRNRVGANLKNPDLCLTTIHPGTIPLLIHPFIHPHQYHHHHRYQHYLHPSFQPAIHWSHPSINKLIHTYS